MSGSLFSGIIESVAEVLSIKDEGALKILKISSPPFPVQIGDSVAINGCCLTIKSLEEGAVYFDLMPETLVKTNFQELEEGAFVNVEPSMTLQKGLHGHLVQGHIDGVGIISEMESYATDGWHVKVKAPSSILDFLVEKGSIAVDGVSLTVIDVNDQLFSFSLVPHTGRATTLGTKKVGDKVNLETDLLAKYLKKWISCT